MAMLIPQKFDLSLIRLSVPTHRLRQLSSRFVTQRERIHRPQGIRVHSPMDLDSLVENSLARLERLVHSAQLRETARRVGEGPDGVGVEGPEGAHHGVVGAGVQGERFVGETGGTVWRAVAAGEGVLGPDYVVVCWGKEGFQSAEGTEMERFGFGMLLQVATDAPEFVDGDYYVEVVVGKESGEEVSFLCAWEEE
ncbi:hypothetical protein BHYA_0187g00100 [Botrytis hyacinthi]|uniref:Uncharacterized protein n=1 Tax=Botrytis hyacinthi TaxID=278943 RepID=A0A4Z1GJK5_9HELO|nr:hypothetical protein BHYA_0187g00100 [Botrytis hyacinthi]